MSTARIALPSSAFCLLLVNGWQIVKSDFQLLGVVETCIDLKSSVELGLGWGAAFLLQPTQARLVWATCGIIAPQVGWRM